MIPVVELKDNNMTICTDKQKTDYCKTATLFYVLEGQVTFEYDNRSYELNASDVLVINRGTEYAFRSKDNLYMASLELTGKTFETICDGVRHYVICNSGINQSEYYIQLCAIVRKMVLNQFYIEEDGKRYTYLIFEYYALYYKLLEMLAAYFIEGGTKNELEDFSNRKTGRRDEIERYLNIHYMEAVSLDDISKELFISKGYLSKYFFKCFGMTFSQYLKELRLKHAMNDLLYTDYPITKIALDNGFSGSSFFNKAFREKYKKNPTEVRSEFRKNVVQSDINGEVHDKLKRILDMPDSPTVSEKKRFGFSVLNRQSINPCWNKIINIGSAAEILRTDIQSHMMILSKYMKYVRFWDPFSEEMLLDIHSRRTNYNFLRLDQVLDSILNIGMKPFIVFEPKLERVNERVDSVIIKAQHENIIENIDLWKSIMTAFVRHVIQKYGVEEVEQWGFELTYDTYRLKGVSPEASYLEIFEATVRILEEYTNKPMLGGPALPSAECNVFEHILSGLLERKCLPGFVSMISFAYESNEEMHTYSIRSIDEDYLLKDVLKCRKLMEKNGCGHLPLYVTEWNETIADRNFINDSCYRGAYIVKNLLDVCPYISAVGYFSGTDLRSEYFDSGNLLYGGNGLITRDGIFKPSGFALELMNLLADDEIGRDRQFLITADKHSNYYVIAHNKRKLGYYFYKTPEEQIEKEKAARYCEDEERIEMSFELSDMKNGIYQIRIHRVNAQYGSILNLWKELDYSEHLTRKDIMYLRRICEPHLLFRTESVTNHKLTIKYILEANEIVLIEIKRNI